MTDELKLGTSEGDGCVISETKGDNRSSEETKMDSNLPNGYLGDQNDFSESMLLGQFPDNFDVSDACGWMTHDDFTDFQQQKRFEGNDGQQMGYNGNDNRFNSNYKLAANPIGQQGSQVSNQGQGTLQNNGQQNNHQSTTQLIHQQLTPLLHTQLAQPSKVQEIILSSSQYNQQLHEMHLHHLEQISHTTNSSEYYNRPLEGPRSVLPIDSMNHETGESHKDGNDSGESSGDDSDFGDMEEGEEGDEGKRRKNASQQSAKAKNREHAKNTRIRKKHYIEALKESLKLLFDEREKIDKDRRNSLSRLAEQANVRKQVLQTMFFYRASAETSLKRWGSILDDNFQLVLPITPYRSFPPAEVVAGQRRVNGVEAMIVDTTSLSVMVQSIGLPHKDGDKVRVQYYSGPEDTIMTGDSFMCKWLLRTENAVSRGARYEVFKQGMIKATFTPQNRMVYLELSFDVMSFMQQLRRASGKQDFQVVPNTVSIAKEDACEARVITEATHPYRITYASQSWCDLFGYEAAKVIGQTCKMLQGEETEMDRIEEVMNGVKYGRAGSTVLTNYNSDGEKITISLRTYPLYTEIALTHYLGVVEPVYSKFSESGSVSTSGHTTEGSVSSSLSPSRASTFKNESSEDQDMGFIHSLTLPQSNGWVKKEPYDNGSQGTSRSSANTNRNQDQTSARSQSQNPLKERNNSQNGNSRPSSDMVSHTQPSYPQTNTNNRNTPNNNYVNNSSTHINSNNNNNTNTSSHPQPASYHQHHTHHQHQVPPHETELSRFPPQDATYKASARQNQGSSAGYSLSASNNLPHQVAPTQQQQQQAQQVQQQQQQKLSLSNIQENDYEAFSSSLEMFSPSSPNPAPHKSSKPNAPFVTTNSGQHSQSNMNTTNDSSMQNSFPNTSFSQYDSSNVGIDTDDMESESCPATRIPEWCQELRTSTPLSLSPDDTSGGCSSNYSDSNSPFDNDEKE